MPISDTYDIRDLRLFAGRDLRALLKEESRTWQQRLRWDYSQSIELLLGYLDNRILPGYVAVERRTGQIHGYTFAVLERDKAIVGDLFISEAVGHVVQARVQRLLLQHQLPMLQHTPGVDRVESQLLLTMEGQEQTFQQAGFRTFPRLFMEAGLPAHPDVSQDALFSGQAHLAGGAGDNIPVVPGLRIRRWTAPVYQPAAELIHRAYAAHGDTVINDQYATVQGCLRFLHNIVRFPGCGVFAPEHSWVLATERTGEVEGLVLATRVEADTAHVPQLCVHPRHRGRGLGRTLMQQTMNGLRNHGFRAITLTVTEANSAALSLYQSLGFGTRHAFEANVWTR